MKPARPHGSTGATATRGPVLSGSRSWVDPEAGWLVGRAVAAGALAVAFGAVAHWPLVHTRGALFVANLVVAGAIAPAAVLLSAERNQRRAAGRFLAVAFLWPAAWLNVWNVPPLTLIAGLIGPLPELLAISALLDYPRPLVSRAARVLVATVIVVGQVSAAAATLIGSSLGSSASPAVIAIWHSDTGHRVAGALYDFGSAAIAAPLAVAFLIRTSRLRGPDRTTTLPIGVSVLMAGLASTVSSVVAGTRAPGDALNVPYIIEAIALGTIPLTFLFSVVIRILTLERMGQLTSVTAAGPRTDELERALRTALSDKTLTLQVWSPATEQWIDATGHRVRPPAVEMGRSVYEVVGAREERLAQIRVDTSMDRHHWLLDAAANALRLTLANANLLAAIAQEISATRESERRLERAITAEGRRIRALTASGPAPRVARALIALEPLAHGPDRDLAAAISRAIARVEDVRTDLAQLGHPDGSSPVDSLGLRDALVPLAAAHSAVTARITSAALPLDLQRVAYFITSEALTNALKHAAAEHISLDIDYTEGDPTVRICVADDGRGGANPHGHGLMGIADRIQRIGGQMRLVSAPGVGTTVSVELPVA